MDMMFKVLKTCGTIGKRYTGKRVNKISENLSNFHSILWCLQPRRVFSSVQECELVTAGSGLMLRLLLISSCLISADL